MDFIKEAEFICADPEWGSAAPKFKKEFSANGIIKSAELQISALGVFEAFINGVRVGNDVLAPGWTEYASRLLYRSYDVTDMLSLENEITVGVGCGWYGSPMMGRGALGKPTLIAALKITYRDGRVELIATGEDWLTAKSEVTFSEIYDGEACDGRIKPCFDSHASVFEYDKGVLCATDGELIVETERVCAKEIIRTPNGEVVIDFGQNLTGYVEFSAEGNSGDTVEISHAEILDKDGNFYTENYRTAKAKLIYTLKGGKETYKPHYTFFGFRYIRLDSYPAEVKLENFTAVVVHSDIKRTGYLSSGIPKLNKLFENIIWGQRGNFLDVPTDCPQRNERCGWTGDAQVFCRTASLNFNCNKFFKKWLRDLAAAQLPDGGIPRFVPNTQPNVKKESAAWSDAATVMPYEHYMAYADKDFLAEMLPMMKGWVDYIEAHSVGFLWLGGNHYGDWLGIDAPEGSYKGATDDDLIATAFFYHSTRLLIKAGKILGADVSHYEEILPKIKAAFSEKYIAGGKMSCDTQTAHVLAIHFGLVDDKAAIGNRLIELIEERGDALTTGFVGTPYLLDALTEIGRADKAYALLLREEYPSWLYSVNQGATTIWEHWDGMREDGTLWSSAMNSFNHYAYGSVAAWVYRTAAGIKYDEASPAYKHFFVSPTPDERIGRLSARLETEHGIIESAWEYQPDGSVKYEIAIPDGTSATVTVNGITEELGAGRYTR